MTKEEIAQNEQFLLLPQRFPLLVIGYPFNYRDFLFFDKYVQSHMLQICYMRERVNSNSRGIGISEIYLLTAYTLYFQLKFLKLKETD